MKYISLGMQCTTAEVLTQIGIKTETLPFDWILTGPYYIYKILELILDENIPIDTVVREHFFKISNKVKLFSMDDVEHWYIDDELGPCIYNSEYRIVFPHDQFDEEHILKYIRRFERLIHYITNPDIPITVIYTSESSYSNGNYEVNQERIVFDSYRWLNMIYKLIRRHSKQPIRFIIYDALKVDDPKILDKNIELVFVEAHPKMIFMIHELKEKFRNKLIKN